LEELYAGRLIPACFAFLIEQPRFVGHCGASLMGVDDDDDAVGVWCVYLEEDVLLLARLTRCKPDRSSAFQEAQIMAATCFIK
jgi:hypothetical protein